MTLYSYNLEFDEAIDAYTELVARNPNVALAYSDLASAYLYRELHRLGRLDSKAFVDGNRFVREQRPNPSPEAIARVMSALNDGRALAQRQVAEGGQNAMAHYALCTNAVVRATLSFMIEKAWIATIRQGAEAKSQCEKVRESDPQFADAYLVLGLHEYAVASLPRSLRFMFALGGLQGKKQRGLEYVERTAIQRMRETAPDLCLRLCTAGRSDLATRRRCSRAWRGTIRGTTFIRWIWHPPTRTTATPTIRLRCCALSLGPMGQLHIAHISRGKRSSGK